MSFYNELSTKVTGSGGLEPRSFGRGVGDKIGTTQRNKKLFGWNRVR